MAVVLDSGAVGDEPKLRWRAIGKEVPGVLEVEEAPLANAPKPGKAKNDAETADDDVEKQTPPMTLRWSDLELRVPVQDPTTKLMGDKVILANANGIAYPGQLLAIMGPSGAGKSSLLDCISGRNSAVTGQVTVNGQPWTSQLRKFASYALQDDLFHATLTVEEHLTLQARLRMGRSATDQQRSARVNTVMEELGLTKSKHTLIGGWMIRGISGGERKRLAFATEILTNPSILFVDEPTSGLDSCMAKAVMTQLKELAVQDGRTVVAAIHQPSSEVFALFNQLYLLADGATIYHGPAVESISYFGARGFQCPTFINPADYFMDQLVIMDRDSDPEGVKRLENLKQLWREAPPLALLDSATTGSPTKLHGSGDAPTWNSSKVDVVVYVHLDDDQPVSDEKTPCLPLEDDEDRRLPFWGQVDVLAHRNALRLLRDKMAFRLQVIQTLIFAFLLGSIFFQLELNQQGIPNFAGAFFYIVTDQVYAASMPGLCSVPVELPMVYREQEVGLYNVAAWFVAKNLCELPIQLILPVIELIPIYLLLGIGQGVQVFLTMQLLLIAMNSCCVAFGYAVGCVCRRIDIAPIVGNIIIMPLLLLGGLFVNSDAVPYLLRWIEHITPFKYGYYGFMRIFWQSVSAIECNPQGENCWARSGADVLAKYNIIDRPVWHDIATLLMLGIAFRVAGLVALQLTVRRK